MARRWNNRNADLIELVVKLGGLVFLLILISPSVRAILSTLGAVAVLVVAILLTVGLGYLLFRLIRKRRGWEDDIGPNLQHFTSVPVPERIQRNPVQFSTPASLIDQLRTINWYQFEKLVALVYKHRGYKVTRRGGANPDGGIDLILELNGQQSAVQCKQWKTWNVGVKAVREFLGALTDAQMQRGIFITLNGYTGDAKKLAEKHGIEIINETGLTAMLEEVNILENPGVMELLKDTRKFCPRCERLMVERVAKKGTNSGQRFWGCSGYPKCNYILRI